MEPRPRYRHELAVYGDLMYVFGGGTSFISYLFDFLPAYNIRTGKWTRVDIKGETRVLPVSDDLCFFI